jgi:hypothetical protein
MGGMKLDLTSSLQNPGLILTTVLSSGAVTVGLGHLGHLKEASHDWHSCCLLLYRFRGGGGLCADYTVACSKDRSMPEPLPSPHTEDVFCWEFPVKLGLISDSLPSLCTSWASVPSHSHLFLDVSGFSS